jgi:hypothetical protein
MQSSVIFTLFFLCPYLPDMDVSHSAQPAKTWTPVSNQSQPAGDLALNTRDLLEGQKDLPLSVLTNLVGDSFTPALPPQEAPLT